VAGLTGFARRLGTVLTLRMHLHYRRLRSRGLLYMLGGALTPLVFLGALVVAGVGALAVFGEMQTLHVAAALSAVVAGAHLMLLLEVAARVGRGEGMAAALYHFPLSPALIHASETLVGGLSLPVIISAVVLLAGAVHLGGVFAFFGAILGAVYLLGLRQLLQLLLSNLLRRRFLREAVLGVVSLAGLGLWLGFNWLAYRLGAIDVPAWLADAPLQFWLLPSAWFVVPFAEIDIGWTPRVVGYFGGPMLVLAVYVVGFDLQDAACFGEAPTLLRRDRRRRRRKRWHLADRGPLRLVPPAVFAPAGKELRVVRRDPFLLVMLLSQALVLLAPIVLFPGLRSGGLGAGYLPFVVLLLLWSQHTPLFNLVGLEGRALQYLAQTPVPRWQVLVGKNLAYATVFGAVDIAFLCVAAWIFDGTSALPVLLGLIGVGLVLLMGVGNFVSAWLPMPWIGARGAAGGTRAAQAASEGGVERPGCGTLFVRFAILQTLTLLMLPPIALLYGAKWWLPPAAWAPVIAAVVSYAGLFYVVGTALAVARLRTAEDKLLALVASRASS